MESKWVSHNGEQRLILIFLGWGSDNRLVEGLSKPGYDILALWDYREENFDFAQLSSYSEICVIAWSLGVMEAARTLHGLALPITLKLAINGTASPVDAESGIAPQIFEGTLANMNERNLLKFFRRMCKDAAEFAKLQQNMPDRLLPELIDELSILRSRAVNEAVPDLGWSRALVGSSDAIFTKDNQLRSWQGIPTTVLDSGHLPPWRDIIDRYVVDKNLVAERFGDTRHLYEAHATAQLRVAERLWSLCESHIDFSGVKKLLEVGSGTGMFTRCYIDNVPQSEVELWDLTEAPLYVPVDRYTFVRCDAETRAIEVGEWVYDCILTASTMQWFNDPARFLLGACTTLKRGGYMAIATYGPATCMELEQYGNASFPDLNRLLGWLPSDMEVLHASQEEFTITFPTPREALRHIRMTGVNASRRLPASVSSLRAIIDRWRLNQMGEATLTFNPIYIILCKR